MQAIIPQLNDKLKRKISCCSQFDNIPQELKDLKQWVCWKLEEKRNRKGEIKQTKPPYNPHTRDLVDPTNPQELATFDEAITALKNNSSFKGIGFCFFENDPYTGIDLDKCLGPDGANQEEALQIIQRFNSYTEITQSGKGFHILVKASISPEKRNKKNGWQEIYDRQRYFVMTGNIYSEIQVIEERQEEVNEYHSTFEQKNEKEKTPKERKDKECPQKRKKEELNKEDHSLIERAKKARNGAKFDLLWSGNWEGNYHTQSEADQAFCNFVANYNKEKSENERITQIERLIHNSGLEREKLYRGDYIGPTINKALFDRFTPREQKRKPLPEIEKPKFLECEMSELEELVLNLKNNTTLFFQAPTGLGKTHSLINTMVKAKEKRFVFFCSTNQEATKVLQETNVLLEQEGSKEQAFMLSSLEGMPQEKTIKESRIVITNYGYLGRQGMTSEQHRYLKAILENRTVICDEVQELYQKMKVFHPIRTRYLEKAKEYSEVKTCPKDSKKGDCSNCVAGYLRREPEGKGKEREFYKKVPISAFEEISQEFDPCWTILEEAGFKSWEDLINPDKYKQVFGTLYFSTLKINRNYSKQEADNEIKDEFESYEKYLERLLKSLESPQIRIEFPLVEGVGAKPEEALETSQNNKQKIEEKKEVQFPKKPCTVPNICGIDPWPLWQITKNTNAKNVIFTSATIPRAFYEIAKDISKRRGWSIEEREVIKPPFTFDVTLLKTEEELGTTNLSTILKNLFNREEKVFTVASQKAKSQEIYKIMSNAYPEYTELFEGQDFEGEKYKHKIIEEKRKGIKYLITYTRSALTKGTNLPDVNIVFVECNQFIPQSALGTLKENMTTEEKREKLAKDILENLTQICGRVLRSNLKRVQGQTIKDPRKIVIVLHSLPKELSAFRIDENLTHSQKEFFDFINPKQKEIVQSATNAILNCLDDKIPEKMSTEKEKKRLSEKYKKGAKRNMSPSDRKILTLLDIIAIKNIERIDRHKRKIKELQSKGYDKRTIMNNINLSRLSKNCPECVTELGNFLDQLFQ